MQSTLIRPGPSMETRRETFERAATVARDYSRMAARIFRGNKCEAAELADQIVKNEVSLDGGCDLVLLRDESLAKELRRLRILEAATACLPETLLVDVTAIVDDEPHIDGFDVVRWERAAVVAGRMGAVEIRCAPCDLEEVEGRWLLSLNVEGTVRA